MDDFMKLIISRLRERPVCGLPHFTEHRTVGNKTVVDMRVNPSKTPLRQSSILLWKGPRKRKRHALLRGALLGLVSL